MAMTKEEKNARAAQLRWERQDRLYQGIKGQILSLYLDAPKESPFPLTHEAILAKLGEIIASPTCGKLNADNHAKALGVHEAMHEWLMREVMVYTHVVGNWRVERGDPIIRERIRSLNTDRSCFCYKLADGRYLPLNQDQRALDFSQGVWTRVKK